MKPILEIKGISKKYQIQGNTKPYLSLRESLFSFLKPSSKKEEFWALKDISFNVMPGDTLGIIGKNGAGKSTLLKILSKITPPTSGNIISRGRIASLLEVGTGFHPELSGRENIFLNGSILGMKRSEIQKQFDAIVDFSGVEKFLDTPLKHYSSGMQLRLAFAVAAFLEPEILVIDEVLAVGDAEFQKKCMGKMGDISKSGRTILFVSHQLSSIDLLCKKGILLNKGELIMAGNTKDVIDTYVGLASKLNKERSENTIIYDLEIVSDKKDNELFTGDTLCLSGKISLPAEIKNPSIGIVIKNSFNVPIIGINNKTYGVELQTLLNNRFQITLNSLPLSPGTYDIDFFIGDGITDVFTIENALSFDISDRNIFENGKNPESRLNSFIVNKVNWELNAF